MISLYASLSIRDTSLFFRLFPEDRASQDNVLIVPYQIDYFVEELKSVTPG